MPWLDERTSGIPNKVWAGGAVAALLGTIAMGILAGLSGRSTARADAAHAKTATSIVDDTPVATSDTAPPPFGQTWSLPSGAARGSQVPSGTPAAVKLAVLMKSDAYNGKNVCTCGFVQSFGSSPDHSVDGTRLNVLHNIYVSELARLPRDNGSPATAICMWTEGSKPNVKEGQQVCVQGEYVGPIVKTCSVVPSCP